MEFGGGRRRWRLLVVVGHGGRDGEWWKRMRSVVNFLRRRLGGGVMARYPVMPASDVPDHRAGAQPM